MKLQQNKASHKKKKGLNVKYEFVQMENHDEGLIQAYNLIFEEIDKLANKKYEACSPMKNTYEKHQTVRVS